MKTIIGQVGKIRLFQFITLLATLLPGSLAYAQLSDFTEQQRTDYELIANTLSDLNGSIHSAESIVSETYWVDADKGVDDYNQSGQIDQPWQSISWAMNNVPFAKQSANIVVRSGTYAPTVLYFGKERGGSLEVEHPFNLLAFPEDDVRLDGRNVGDNGALISIASAEHITISGFDMSRISGSGKSGIYLANAQRITLTNNTIHHSQWTHDPAAAASPTLSDRLNGIAVVGESRDIAITHNELHDLTTGYGEPILVVAPAVATVADNDFHDNDAEIFENQQYYVSPAGDDEKGVGSMERPWKTIHKAMFSIPYAEDNATINVRKGRYEIPTALYFEALRGGSAGKYFTLQAYNDEEVIIDGGLLKQPFSAMVSISSAAYVRIKGLSFTHLKGPKSGIYMEGNAHHIELIDNKLYGMTWADDADEDPGSPKPSDNLNPIAVIGNNAASPMRSIVIRGNELYDIVPGYSEGIKIVGNVEGFLVEDNHIHDIANIGIVAAGNYAWVKDSEGVKIPADLNHARDGIIRNNTVNNAVSPVANSAGIYLDGAHRVRVEGNISHHNSVGFSVGCEQPGTADGNVLKNNIAYENSDAGLVVGTIHAGASVTDTSIEYNEFRHNYSKGGWGGELTIQQVDGLSIQNNIFISRSDLMSIAAQTADNLWIDNNLYFGESADAETAVFDWGGIDKVSYVGLSEFRLKTCYDLNSVYQDAGTIDYFQYLATRSADMSDDDLKAHNYRKHRGHKSDHHGRRGKKHGHRKGGLAAGVCESNLTPSELTDPKGKRKQAKHTHRHIHAHKHRLSREERKQSKGAKKRFLRHSHVHTHDHRHKAAH